MKQPIEFNSVKPVIDGITGVLVLFVVVGLPVLGWFYHIWSATFLDGSGVWNVAYERDYLMPTMIMTLSA